MSSFSELVSRDSLGEINVGLTSASEETMIDALGRPTGILTTAEDNRLISPTAKRLLQTRNVGPFPATGIKPALDSLETIFVNVKNANAALFDAVGFGGMLSVRLRRPTSGPPSTKISNHAWGTAIDIKIDGRLDLSADGRVSRGIAALIPFFNDQGWFSGVGFRTAEDDVHFEVAEETIGAWDALGLFGSDMPSPSEPARPSAEPSAVAEAKRFLIAAMNDAGITDPSLRAGIAALAQVESDFQPRSEMGYGHTSVARIRGLFGGRVADLNDAALARLASNDEAFFDKVYGGAFGRSQLGNTEPGDGFRFRGRGIFQITGRRNYDTFGTKLGIGLTTDPDLANDPQMAAKLAVAFMLDHDVGDDFEKMKRAVGGASDAATNAEKDRLFAGNLHTGEFA